MRVGELKRTPLRIRYGGSHTAFDGRLQAGRVNRSTHHRSCASHPIPPEGDEHPERCGDVGSHGIAVRVSGTRSCETPLFDWFGLRFPKPICEGTPGCGGPLLAANLEVDDPSMRRSGSNVCPVALEVSLNVGSVPAPAYDPTGPVKHK